MADTVNKSVALAAEIEHLLAHGYEHLSVAAFAARFEALGYALDGSMDCRSSARYLESGRSYPCCTTGLKEIDSGMSAFHFQARRDAKFREMQELRGKIFAVTRGAILEV